MTSVHRILICEYIVYSEIGNEFRQFFRYLWWLDLVTIYSEEILAMNANFHFQLVVLCLIVIDPAYI